MPHEAIYAVIFRLQAHAGFHIDNSARLIAQPQPEAIIIQPDRPRYGASVTIILKEVKWFHG